MLIAVSCLFLLLLAHEQVGSLFKKQAPGAGSRAARSSYYLIDCADDGSHTLTHVAPLPDGRYVYSNEYGWFDKTHFGAGDPAHIIADVETAVAADGGIVSISQSVREGLTGYTAQYLVSGDIASGEIIGVALGIYMDWSMRFEAWQGSLPRNLVGPLTPFAIEDLPTQYISFVESATDMRISTIFACYLGQTENADAPPHIWISYHPDSPANEPGFPEIVHLTNKTFRPLIYTEDGWQHVPWPEPLRLYPIPSSISTWVFESDQTWYLNQKFP